MKTKITVWKGTDLGKKNQQSIIEGGLWMKDRLFLPLYLDRRCKKTFVVAYTDVFSFPIGIAGINHSYKAIFGRWFGCYIKPKYRHKGLAIKLLDTLFREAGWYKKPERAKGFEIDRNLYDLLKRKMRKPEQRQILKQVVISGEYD